MSKFYNNSEDKIIGFRYSHLQITNSIPCAILLQKLIWLAENTDYAHRVNDDGWFFRTTQQLEKDTCLTFSQQVMAENRLIKLGFIQKKVRGIPPKKFFKVDLKAIQKAIDSL